MKITDLKKKDVIHCPTKEQFELILKLADSEIDPSWWCEFKENTCYSPSKLLIDSTDYFEGRGYKIHQADQFLIEDEPKLKKK